jgi:regulator of sigma E protease
MALTQLILHNFLSFAAIISLIVFIHEFGHFYVARLCGVQVEEFAIGFGYELFGFNDKKGTRWKLCLLPFGGYVKMYGDRNGASMPDPEAIAKMSEEDKKKSFISKNIFQRIAIVAAGPGANFIMTIVIFTLLFKLNGLNEVAPIISEVAPESAAFEAGLKQGDEIVMIDDREVKNFDNIREAVASLQSSELTLRVKRPIDENKKEIIEIKVTPKMQVRKDFFGDDVNTKTLGVSASEVSHRDLGNVESFVEATKETYHLSVEILKALYELGTGKRDLKELGGPIKIAKYSGKTVDMGLTVTLWFMAIISVNLGVMNLLPIPVLDGGHLFFYVIELLRGKPLPEKAQRIGFQIGLSLVLSLMAFTIFNDIRQMIAGM